MLANMSNFLSSLLCSSTYCIVKISPPCLLFVFLFIIGSLTFLDWKLGPNSNETKSFKEENITKMRTWITNCGELESPIITKYIYIYIYIKKTLCLLSLFILLPSFHQVLVRICNYNYIKYFFRETIYRLKVRSNVTVTNYFTTFL